jgi:hypothetical protein
MPPRIYTIGTPTNPFLQVVYFILGGLLLIGAVLMGAVILSFAFALALVVGLVIYARVWWLRRKLRRSGGGAGAEGDVLEVEYRVVDERDERKG